MNYILNSCVPLIFFRKCFHEAEHDRRKPLEARSGSCLQAGWMHLWFHVIPLSHLAILAYPLGLVWVLYLPRKWFPNSSGSNSPVSQHPLLRYNETVIVSFQENKHWRWLFIFLFYLHILPTVSHTEESFSHWWWEAWGLFPKLSLGRIHSVSACPWGRLVCWEEMTRTPIQSHYSM